MRSVDEQLSRLSPDTAYIDSRVWLPPRPKAVFHGERLL